MTKAVVVFQSKEVSFLYGLSIYSIHQIHSKKWKHHQDHFFNVRNNKDGFNLTSFWNYYLYE